MQLKLMRQVNPGNRGRAANDASFTPPSPHRLFNVSYQLRNGHKGTIPMVSRTMSGAICHVLNILSGTPPRVVDAKPQQVDPC